MQKMRWLHYCNLIYSVIILSSYSLLSVFSIINRVFPNAKKINYPNNIACS